MKRKTTISRRTNRLHVFDGLPSWLKLLTENSSTETEAEYQWMHGAYIHITGSNAKTQCRKFHCRIALHVLSNQKITIVSRI